VLSIPLELLFVVLVNTSKLVYTVFCYEGKSDIKGNDSLKVYDSGLFHFDNIMLHIHCLEYICYR